VQGDAGVRELRDLLLERARAHTPLVELRLDHGNGRLLAELHREGEVTAVRHADDGTYVTARLDPAVLARATRLGGVVVGA
jgi:50S ribosomal subunit-associated GTPase HflX